MIALRLLILCALLGLVPAEAKQPVPTGTAPPAVKPKEVSLVRVNVTGQAYDYTRPWQKRAPVQKRALGAVLPKNRVLVTADLVSNQNYVELERAESGEKTGADVVVIDYEANLALIEPNDKKFLDGLAPLQLATDTVVGDRLAALQLESTGALVITEGLVTTIQMTRYPADVSQFLTYRISMTMQYRDNSYTIPLLKNNKLAGLLLRYDPRSQVLDAIPAPIIAHFLKEAEAEPISRVSVGRFQLLSHARSATAEVRWPDREAGRGLCDRLGTEHARRESRDAGGRHRRRRGQQRDRPKRQLRGPALRENRIHQFDYES